MEEPGSFQLLSVRRLRGSGHKLKYKGFYLNTRRHLFDMRGVEHWNKLSKEVEESPSLEILKT